jgi:hypothetical protein
MLLFDTQTLSSRTSLEARDLRAGVWHGMKIPSTAFRYHQFLDQGLLHWEGLDLEGARDAVRNMAIREM